MKNQTVIKDGDWVWPANDEYSWIGQHKHNKLCDYVLPHIKNHRVMVQAGGNCGYILSTFIEHFDHVYTFEPDPINFYCLTNNVEALHVTKIQACLGLDRQTVQTEQLNRKGRLRDIGGVHVTGTGYTPTIAVDDLNLPYCDLIQLDVEGYELNALRGAINTIKQHKPVLCIEFHEPWLERYKATSDMLVELLETLEYQQVDSYAADRIFVHKTH
jgi:FkbM family methyltransferase